MFLLLLRCQWEVGGGGGAAAGQLPALRGPRVHLSAPLRTPIPRPPHPEPHPRRWVGESLGLLFGGPTVGHGLLPQNLCPLPQQWLPCRVEPTAPAPSSRRMSSPQHLPSSHPRGRWEPALSLLLAVWSHQDSSADAATPPAPPRLKAGGQQCRNPEGVQKRGRESLGEKAP